MAVETTLPRERAQEQEVDSTSALRAQRTQIVDQIRGYIDETFNQKGVAGESETRQLEAWIRTQDATEEGVKSLREFYEGFLSKQLHSGRELFQSFYGSMDKALANRWISSSSYKKWEHRFRDKAAGFKTRENWVQDNLPKYIEGWKKVAEERKNLIGDRRFGDLVTLYPEFAVLRNENGFLEMHFDERKGLVASARAALLAGDKLMSDLYNKAQSKLASAVSKGFLGAGKEGIWLERIFKSSASPKKLEAFVNGSAKNSLSDLMINWHNVKDRYDRMVEKANERGMDTAARGFKIVSPHQFLSMHYTQRLRYVDEAEARLDTKSMENEHPSFVKIRHAMDMKDWDDAAILIAEAKTKHLKDSDWPRLKSMERYVTQFKGKETGGYTMKAMEAKNHLDLLMDRFSHSHSEMTPLVARLLTGNNANRNIHQLRWVWYNNIWCRTHGPPYLDDDVARKGSAEDQEQLTKYRAEQGLDVGRNDVLDYETADQVYFRKQETSKHKATYLHTNVNSGGVQSAVAEKLEREQDPKWLYWTTLCPHVDGDPKSEAWMREGLLILTEMRSLTRAIESAGYRYNGRTEKMSAKN